MFKNKESIDLAIDCMGGDFGPKVTIEAAIIASKTLKKQINFHFFGDQDQIEQILSRNKIYSKYTIYHCTSYIPSDLKPSSVLRGLNREYKDSSMVQAIRAAKEGKVDATISAGNTGALMILGRFILGILPCIDRPAIISCVPNELGKAFALLDLGANIGCTTDDLIQFSLMGAAFFKAINYDEKTNLKPTLALLNIGEEEVKGNDAIKGAYKILKDNYNQNDFFEFIGYIEPNNILKGKIEVVVCDGFAGNVALKTMEGTASMIKKFLSQAFKSSWLAKLGYLLASRSLKNTMRIIDPRNHNGGMFVGLNGILVKSHGGADSSSFANAILVTQKLIKNQINDKIIKQIEENSLFFDQNIN